MKRAAPVLFGLILFIVGWHPAFGGVLLGAHVGYEYHPGSQDEFVALERALGRRLAIDNDHEDWAVMPDSARVKWDIQQHRMTMISWRIRFGPDQGCATADAITGGSYDGQLKKQAQAIKAFGVPILIRFNYEMTNNKKFGPCFTGFQMNRDMSLAGSKYVEAWKHIVTLFRAAGATNAKWVWAPSRMAFKKGNWRPFYPGNEYVDWIGIDIYNHGDVPRSFADAPGIDAFYNDTSGMGKPLMIAETGAVSDPQQNPDPQTLWITTAVQYLKSHPAIKALLWWNDTGKYAKKNPGYGGSGYVLQGRGLGAFKAMVEDPYFKN